MADNVIEELKQKAVGGRAAVFVLAYEPGVVKSDATVSPGLKMALQEAVRPLEQIQDVHRDWHPGSDNKVLDLVHPSLFPLVYGRTRILPHRRVNF